MRPETSIVNDISRLLISSGELKQRQPIGSNQIVFGTYKTNDIYDIGGELSHTSPSAILFLVTATATNQQNLIADIAISISKSPTMQPEYTLTDNLIDRLASNPGTIYIGIYSIPLSVENSNKKQWRVILYTNTYVGAYVYAKVQIIANDDVTLEITE